MTKERDEHFTKWATAVYKRLAQNVVQSTHRLADLEAFKQEQHRILARAAYDLVCEVFFWMSSLDLDRLTIAENVERLTDMAELPEEKENESSD